MIARVKPKQKRLELTLAVNTESPNYDQSKGEQIAINVDGLDAPPSTALYPRGYMDKRVLDSKLAVQNADRYAIGVMAGGVLHISPLAAILHMRPSFDYLNVGDERRRKKEAQEEDSAEGEEEGEAEMVTVKFASDRRRIRDKTRRYHAQQTQAAEEPWVSLNTNSISSQSSELTRMHLVSGTKEDWIGELSLPLMEYLKHLTPSEGSEESPVDNAAHGRSLENLPRKLLQMLPISNRVEALMRNAKLLPFKGVLSLVGTGEVISTLKALQGCSVLVQGNWVLRSDILYPKDTISAKSGIPSDLMCRARDYLLYRYTTTRHVERKQLAHVTRLPNEELEDIFRGVAEPQGSAGWEFQLPFDAEFISKYPDVVQRQSMLWEARSQQLLRSFQEGQRVSNIPGSPKKGTERRHRRLSRRESGSESDDPSVRHPSSSGAKKFP
ncbi:unnamed protein product [Darwinula stevensoni]|uniref:DNA-directed RNA polymerase III subunit RPC5 n=1 Tax=Darwinula stevensoni TaxID=69355 RepID=A0A7R9A2L0_9CRUS|nr:unnamed protein product [Darwinula stevensoni]CAG0880164.1 unnamed protein product [Darwinula stevensoni]